MGDPRIHAAFNSSGTDILSQPSGGFNFDFAAWYISYNTINTKQFKGEQKYFMHFGTKKEKRVIPKPLIYQASRVPHRW
jgi:hypothetical protein